MLTRTCCLTLTMVACITAGEFAEAFDRGRPWTRHTIDNSSRGADGIRLADVNGDKLMDLTTGWEEGGIVRVYLNPGFAKSKQPWPAVTVGKVRSPEDAVFADVDGDGATDVVSCCEGSVMSVFVHWAPADKSQYLNPNAWKTEAIPATNKARRWMYCLPMQLDARRGIDLVAGAKNPNAEVGWLEAPESPRDLAAWRWRTIYKAGWIMSLFPVDVDADGDLDIIITDRKGRTRGCKWLENPGPGQAQRDMWKVHPVGGVGQEVMFMVPADLNKDRALDVLSAVRGSDLLFFKRTSVSPPAWKTFPIRMPPSTGTGKGVNVADIDLDGQLDIVFSCESSARKSGVIWMSYPKSVTDREWTAHEISGQAQGIKFDLIQLLDLDNDGDQDVVTCEERDNLGVIWYENPTR